MLNDKQREKLLDLITDIRNTRAANNENWMGLLELAVIYAPEKALACLQGVRDCDAKIHDKFLQLVDELERVVQ